MVSWVTITALLAAVGGPIGVIVFPSAIQFSLGMFINLKENGMVYPAYMNPPFASIASYYIYEIKNPKETLQGGKMNLALKGPYYYDAYLNRDNIAFSEGEERVKFHTHRKLHLREDKSQNLDEKFWLINPILPSVAATTKKLVLDRIPFQQISEPIVFNSVNVLLDNFKERLIQKRTARDFLEGKKIELLESLTSLADRFGLASFVPPGPPENVFGVAFFQNNTVDVIEVYTGVGKTKEKFGDVYKWKDKDKLTQWSGQCNVIRGTNGELYKPNVPRNKSINVFVSQLCRSFQLDPVQPDPIPVQDGLMALEFEVTPRIYMGTKSYPKNQCFCKDTKSYDCLYDGFIGMGPCFFDAPLYFSRSNYKGVDRRIRSLVNEDSFMYDLPQKQSFYLEPNTGAILKVNLTLTGSFKIVKQRYMRDLANIQNLTYAPAFVATEFIEVPSAVTLPLYFLQQSMAYYGPFYILLSLGGVIILIMRLLAGCCGSKKKLKPSETSARIPKQVPSSSSSNSSGEPKVVDSKKPPQDGLEIEGQ